MVRDAATPTARTGWRRACSKLFATRRPTRRSSAIWASSACSARPFRRIRRPGPNYVCYGLVAREVERVDSGYRSMMSVQSSLVMVPIFEFGNEATKQKYLPKLATGEWIGCFGLTEPDHGSDPGSMVTRARKVAGGYSLTGAKMWISNSPIADVFVVGPRTRTTAIRGFVLEKGGKGLRAGDPRQGRPTRHRHRPGRDGQLDGAGRKYVPRRSTALRDRSPASIARASASPGRARRGRDCYHRARQYVLHRKQFGRPLAANQLVQKKLADMLTEIALGRRAACGSAHATRKPPPRWN